MKLSSRLPLLLSAAICIVLASALAARAVEVPATLPTPTKPDAQAVSFLLAAAAEDFKAGGATRPIAIRSARVGYFPEATTGRYMLCGSFRLAAGPQWVKFATIKTSPYEQWIGGMAESQCANKRIKWYGVNYANELMQRVQSM